MLKQALEGRNLSILKVVCACPAAHGITDLEVIKALNAACEGGFVAGFALLCEHLVTPSTRELLDRHMKPLIQACIRGQQPDNVHIMMQKLNLDREQKNMFLQAVCNSHLTNTVILCALLNAASFSRAVLSAALLAVVAQIPLNTAACEALLQHGADVNATEASTGRTFAHLIISQHYGNGMDIFLRHGLTFDHRDANGNHCLVPAFSQGLCGLISRLIEDPKVCAVIRPEVLGVDVLDILLEKRHLQCCAVKAIARPGVQGGLVRLAEVDRWWPNLAHFVRHRKRHLSDCFVFRWRHNLIMPPGQRESRQPVVDRMLLLMNAVMENFRAEGEPASASSEALFHILHVLLLSGFLSPCQARFLCSETSRNAEREAVLSPDLFLRSAVPSLVLLAVRAVRAAVGPEDFALRVSELPLPPRVRKTLTDERALRW